jgi:lactoylglutathione lyase
MLTAFDKVVKMGFVLWDHVHIRSRNPEETARWFEYMFGAEIVRTTVRNRPRVGLSLGGQSVLIAEVTANDHVNPPPVTPYEGLEHIGLSVIDIDAVAAELKDKGAAFLMEPHIPRPGIRVCFLQGPDGILVELLERDARFTCGLD